MKFKLTGAFLMLLVFSSMSGASDGAQERTRAQIADIYKWNLTDLYQTDEAWRLAKNQLNDRLPSIKEYEGRLGGSSENLQKALDNYFEIVKEFYRLYSYASRSSDLDTREAGPLAMEQEMSALGTKMNTASAFIDPEILAIDEKVIAAFFKENKKLGIYKQYVDDIQRRKAHTMSSAEEKIIADAGIMAGSPGDIYGIFSNADLPRPEITLSGGERVKLDAQGYGRYRAGSNREDRKAVFEAFFSNMKTFERTFGTQLYAQIKKDMFYKNARNYNTSLESALDANNIPVSVYTSLIDNAHKNLPTLHRYLNLRKQMMGLDKLQYFDMYPSLVKDVDLKYSVEEAQKLIKTALKPLGSEYIATLDKAFSSRWIDMYPTTGKRSGAYSTGDEYDVHPFILMNYNDKYDDVSTLAHELGHTMHSYFSNKTQPFVNSQYPIFLAEVASTSNEALLIDHVLQTIKDPQVKLALLGNYLEGFRTTLFRQTMFAEFELKIHELAESGEALTGERFSQIYLELLKQYYGAAEGVTEVDDLYGIEWAYIPHFYYNFYVFQYSTSFCASTALAEKMKTGGQPMVDKYIKDFLSAGSSDYAIPILNKVGVNMATSEPFDLTIRKMNAIMDEIEKIIAR